MRTIAAFRPTRLGAILIAIAAGHATALMTPTHAMDTAVLVWAVTLRMRGHTVGAIVLATSALFVKMSMATVLLAAFACLIILDALRARSSRPLVALLAFPIVFGIGAALCAASYGVAALAGSFDARAVRPCTGRGTSAFCAEGEPSGIQPDTT